MRIQITKAGAQILTKLTACARSSRAARLVMILAITIAACLTAFGQEDTLWSTYVGAATKAADAKDFVEAERYLKLAEAAGIPETDDRYAKTEVNLVLTYLSLERHPDANAARLRLLKSLAAGAGQESAEIAQMLWNVGNQYQNRKLYAEAISVFRPSLEIYKQAMKPGDANLVNFLNSLANNYFFNQQLDEAKLVFAEELAMLEKDPLKNESIAIVYVLGDLGLIAKDQNQFAEAESYQRRALKIVEKTFGVEHPHTAQILMALFFVLEAEKKFDEADPVMIRARKIDEKVFGPGSKEVVFDIDAQAALFRNQKRWDDAAANYNRELEIFRTLEPVKSDDITAVGETLTGIYWSQHRYRDSINACDNMKELLTMRSRASAETDSFLNVCYYLTYFQAGDYASEGEVLRNYVDARMKLKIAKDDVLLARAAALASSYIRQVKYPEALRYLQLAQRISDEDSNAPPSHLLLYSFSRYYYFTGDIARADQYFQKLLPLLDKDFDAKNGTTSAWYRKGYALVLYERGKTAEADSLFQKSVELLGADAPNAARDQSSSWVEWAALLMKHSKLSEAEDYYKKAIEARQSGLGPNHPELATALEGYAALLRKMGRNDEATAAEQRAKVIRATDPLGP